MHSKDMSSTSIDIDKERYESIAVNTSASLNGSCKKTREAYTMM